MKYELHGRPPSTMGGAVGAPDIQIAGIGTTHVRVRNHSNIQHILFAVVNAPAAGDWIRVEPGETVDRKLVDPTVWLRKPVYHRYENHGYAGDPIDVTAEVDVSEVDWS